MIGKLIVLFMAGLMFSQAEAAVNLPEVLYPLIEQELSRAKLDLDVNTVSSVAEIQSLKTDLDQIWVNIKNKGFSESNATDTDLRAAYVTMQGVIELAITKALEKGTIQDAVVYIITPRMPTPLMLQGGSGLSEINLKDPHGFAKYRNPILVRFLRAGGVVNAFYSHDAKTVLLDQVLGLEYYASYCNDYSNLIDNVIGINFKEFPAEMTGAVYLIDGLLITIESRQLMQIDNTSQQSWAIKFGKHAELRKNNVDKFLEQYFSGPF